MPIGRHLTALISIAGIAGLAACGANAEAGKAPDSAKGKRAGESVKVSSLGGRNVLADGDGRALYLFKKDAPNKTNCTGECLAAWPSLSGPAKAGAGVKAGKLSTITRPEGSKQVTYAGKPLYHFAKDKKPGDTFGQGVKGVWFLVNAKGNAIGDASVTARTIGGERVLTDGTGRTLYEFLKDKPGKSNCVDKVCRNTWPVLGGPAKAGAGVKASKLSTITRPDGTVQATYGGKPLYYHVRDKKPGDIRGRGFKGVWCLVDVKG